MIRGGRGGVGIGVMVPGYALDSSPIACNNSCLWTPARDPDIIFGGVVDLGLYPTALAFPADPLVNGDFEGAAGPPPAGWLEFQAFATRVAGSRPGGSGSFIGRVDWDGVNAAGIMYQNGIVPIGNTSIIDLWYQTDGVGQLLVGWGNVDFQALPVSANWQHAVVIGTNTGVDDRLRLQMNNFAAGRFFQVDDVVTRPQNSSAFTDLFSPFGNHLTNIIAADCPLYTPSGNSGYLQFDGVNDFLARNIPSIPQPFHEVFGLTSWNAAAFTFLFDGWNQSAEMYQNAAREFAVSAGLPILHPLWALDPPLVLDAIYDGVNSFIAINGGVPIPGNVGGNVLNSGFTLGATGLPTAFWSRVGVVSAQLYAGHPNATQYAQRIDWAKRANRKAGFPV